MEDINPPGCLFLSRIPAEIRLKIYEHILTFERPLKLRQIVAGSKNTSILRTNHQIYSEALPIFYDFNTILTTRNDFCQDTDPELQTPLRRDRVRHLLIRNFSQSIRCSSFSGGNNLFLEGCCDVCKPNAAGFIAALGTLPRLQTVIIDYHNHQREFAFIKATIRGIGSTHLSADHGFTLTCTDVAHYTLTSPSLPQTLEITFTDLPFSTIYTTLSHHKLLHPTVHAFPDEHAILERLREEQDRELPHQINKILCMLHSKVLGHGYILAPTWRELQEARAEGRECGAIAERMTEEWTRHIERVPNGAARAFLVNLRGIERGREGIVGCALGMGR